MRPGRSLGASRSFSATGIEVCIGHVVGSVGLGIGDRSSGRYSVMVGIRILVYEGVKLLNNVVHNRFDKLL